MRVQVLHLDLKATNVLLSEDGVAKISDVALAANLQNPASSTASNSSSGVGMWAYSAPEVVNAGEPSSLSPATPSVIEGVTHFPHFILRWCAHFPQVIKR